MKNLFKIMMVVMLGSAVVTSCDDPELATYTGTTLVEFDVNAQKVFVLQDAGFQAGLVMRKIGPIDRESTLTISVIEPDDSSNPAAADGVHYANVPATFTLESGESFDTLWFDAMFNGFSSGSDVRDLQLAIASADGGAELFDNDTVTVTMQQYVPLDLNDFVGTFDVVEHSDRFDEDYNFTATAVINGDGTGLDISFLGTGLMGVFGFTISEASEVIFTDTPGAPSVALATPYAVFDQQTTACGGDPEDVQLRSTEAGTFDALNGTITFSYYEAGVSCGRFNWGHTVLSKQPTP